MLNLIIALVSTLALAHSTPKIHQQQCGLEKDCRINVITSQRPLQASCTGKLFGELDCEMKFKSLDSAEFTILCKDSQSTTHLDATVPVESYSYRVTKIQRIQGAEKLKVDPKTYFAFTHPAFNAVISQSGETLSGEINLLLNKTEHKMDEVVCLSSESEPSLDEPVQTENQF